MALTKRSMGMLPMPLPISVIAEERNAALGSVMFGSARRTDLNKPDRRGVSPRLGPRGQEALGARTPEIIDHDVHARRELILEGVFQRRPVLDKRDGHIGPEACDRFQGVEVAAGRDDLRRSEMLGDLNGQTARRAGRAINQHGLPGASMARSV